MSTDFYEYVPPTEWKTLNALEDFGPNQLPASDALAGRSFEVRLEGDLPDVVVEVRDGQSLAWRTADGAAGGEERYLAREVLAGVFLLDVQLAERPSRAVAVVLDVERGLVTAIVSDVVEDEARGQRVDEQVVQGWLTGGDPADRHARTAAMVGHRVQYVYGAEHVYEHVYLNSSTYTWHCLAGAEAGQADTEPTLAFELRERVYLFAWRERVVPCDGVAVLDWVNLRNNGRIFGWDTEDLAANLIPMGARAILLNETAYAPVED